EQTWRLGAALGRRLRPGHLVTLAGPLGAGKTTLVQGLSQSLGVAQAATSPTFVLIIEHQGRWPVLHLDAYRLRGRCYDEMRDAGVLDFVERDDAVKIVEW